MSSEEWSFEIHPHFIWGAVSSAIYAGWYVSKGKSTTTDLPEKLFTATIWGVIGGAVCYLSPWFMLPVAVMVVVEECPIKITCEMKKKQ